MKNIIVLIITLFISISSFAQQGINYKAIIKDDNGNVVANHDLEVRFFILKSGGGLEYNEDHLATTDGNGLVILTIGQGVPGQLQDFTTIDWGEEDYVLRVGIDLDLDGSFVYFDDTPFNAVPYALLAENVKNQTFKSEDGITYGENTSDDFVFGSSQLDDTGNAIGDSRMFFNTGKGSFRAGRALATEWDDENIGNRSVAFGLNTIATGSYSTALGNRTNAQSYASTAIGTYNVGGGNPIAWVGTDPLFEIGNGTATISTETRNNALTVLKNGRVGIGYNAETPTQTLDISGKIKVSNDFTTPTPGTIRFNETANAFEGYIAETGWVTLGAKKMEKTIVIPAADFVARLVSSMSVAYSSNTVYLSGSTPSSTLPYVVAPLVVPVGSRLISISYVFEDDNPNTDLSFVFSKYCGDSNVTSETITTINTHVANGIESSNLHKYTYNINETIQAGCQYVISASAGANWGNGGIVTGIPGVKVHKVYVRYEEE